MDECHLSTGLLHGFHNEARGCSAKSHTTCWSGSRKASPSILFDADRAHHRGRLFPFVRWRWMFFFVSGLYLDYAKYSIVQEGSTAEAVCERLGRRQFEEGEDLFAVQWSGIHKMAQTGDIRGLRYCQQQQRLPLDRTVGSWRSLCRNTIPPHIGNYPAQANIAHIHGALTSPSTGGVWVKGREGAGFKPGCRQSVIRMCLAESTIPSTH